MTTQSLSSVPANSSQYDLPSLATAPQWDQQAAPFSQLLQQVQAATTPAAPPAPPPEPRRTQTARQANGNAPSPGPSSNSQASPSSSDQPTNGDSAQAPTAPSSPSNAANGAAAPSDVNHADPNNPVAQTAKTPGKDKADGKKGADDSGKHADDSSQTTAPTITTAEVIVPPVETKGNDQAKSSKDADKNTTKDSAKGQSDNTDPTSPAVPDGTAQAAANAVTTVIADQTTDTKSSSKDKAGKEAIATGSASQAATAALLAQTKPTNGPAQSGAKSPKAVTPTANSSFVAGAAPTAENEASLTATPPSQAASYGSVQAIASQAEVAAAPSTATDVPPTVVQAVATVAATEAQVVSTITVDASTATAASNSAPNDSAPTTPPGSAPTNAPPAAAAPFTASVAQNAAPSNTANPGVSTVDRARFVQRVARAFQTTGDQGGQMRLRLSPPELGSLQMQISVKQGALSATIQADNSTAQQLLLDSLPDLRDRLAQQDIRIERFDVQLTGQGSGGMPQSPQGNPDFSQAGRRPSAAANSLTNQAPPTAPSATGAPVLASGALNVVV